MNDYLIYTVTHNDILYTGMMYHENEEVGHWITTYTVVRDLEVLAQVYIYVHIIVNIHIIVYICRF